MAIPWAKLLDLQFGKDIVFTYGPLGFLHQTYVDYSLWVLSLITILSAHVIFLVVLGLFVRKVDPSPLQFLVLLSLVPIMSDLQFDYKLLLSSTLILYMSAIEPIKSRHWPVATAPFLLALVSLIKFNFFVSSIGVVLAYVLMCSAHGRRRDAITVGALYSTGIIFFWLLAGQRIANLPAYFVNNFEVSTGFSEAMSSSGPFWQLIIGVTVLIFFAAVLAVSAWQRKTSAAAFVLLAAVPIFLAFKHGFVRHDTSHVIWFFSSVAILLLCQFFVLSQKDWHPVWSSSSLILLLIVIFAMHKSFADAGWNLWARGVNTKVSIYTDALSTLRDKTHGLEATERARTNIKNFYAIDAPIIDAIGRKPIDVFPWDTSIAWAYDLNWSPRPVFQSYASYTTSLDRINADHFSGSRAPEKILYAYKSIDGRYPAFDEPLTFTRLLESYEFEAADDEFILLTKSPQQPARPMDVIDTRTVQVGETIPVPPYPQGLVFAQVELDLSSVGRMLKIAYKPSPAFIKFKPADAPISRVYRFVPAVSGNGLLVSNYIADLDDLENIFDHRQTSTVEEITIWTKNPQHYSSSLKITFRGLPRTGGRPAKP